MNRKQLINFIPKPENKDVIIYDLSLSDLIDKDVFKEYLSAVRTPSRKS
jgi:hypothetical protein